MMTSAIVLAMILVIPCASETGLDAALSISFRQHPGQIEILVEDSTFATYVYDDPEIMRPFFCQVKAPNGLQVTRTHPPDPETDKDNLDHATYHPGIWLAFGDLGGQDYWRNKARVRHVRFEQAPVGGAQGVFTVVNAYETAESPPRVICEETCTYKFSATKAACWLIVSTRFNTAAKDIGFGDQEEMGLGIRLATPLTVKLGSGTLLNSEGGVDEKGTWGKQADWCSYSAVVENARSGLALMNHPNNFRPSWFHTRDYGLMVANPFGKKAMTGPEDEAVQEDTTPLRQGEPFRLGFAVCVFSADNAAHPDYKALYEAYLKNQPHP